MASNATAALGAQEIAGSFVSRKGLTKQITGQTAARVAAQAVGTIAPVGVGGSGGDPEFGDTGYIAVTASEVAIVQAKSGLMKPKVGNQVIARAPRDQIASVELDAHLLTAGLTIAFTNGQVWAFEVPRVFRSTAQGVVQVLGGRIV